MKSVTNEVGAVAIRGATDWEFEVLEHRGYRRGFYPAIDDGAHEKVMAAGRFRDF